VSGQIHTLVTLPWGKSHRYPLDRKLGGPQSQIGRHGKEKILDPYWDSNSDHSVAQPVASRYTDYGILVHSCQLGNQCYISEDRTL
jgi:hypothetical protein